MSEIKKYMKVVRHGKSGTHLTLENADEIVVQEKLDGANASFKRDGDKIRCFSRNTELDYHNTLRGFYNWVQENVSIEDLVDEYTYYGEWLVSHKIKYNEEMMNKFYLFDVYDESLQQYLRYDDVIGEADHVDLKLIPVFYEGRFQSMDHLQQFVGKSKCGEFGEGIVIKNVNYTDKYGNQQFTKIVSDVFAEKAQIKKQKIRNDKDSLDQFIDTYLTKARTEKILHKLVDENILDESYGIEDMGTILKNSGSRIYEDIIEEDLDSLLKQVKGKIGKKFPIVVKQVLADQNRV
jgi:hypothetical protein